MKGRHLFFATLLVMTLVTVGVFWLPLIRTWLGTSWRWPPVLPPISWSSVQTDCIGTFVLFMFLSLAIQFILVLAAERDPDIGVVREHAPEPSRTGLGPLINAVDQVAAAGSKFVIALLILPYLESVLYSGLDIIALSLIAVIVVLLVIYLIGSSLRFLLKAYDKILGSPYLETEITWKLLTS
jgi:hypothetical protein